MSRYVEVDTIAEQLKDTLLPLSLMLNDIVQRKISDAPSIDIVRCGECKWWNCEMSGCKRNPSIVAWRDDDFCSYGERKSDE